FSMLSEQLDRVVEASVKTGEFLVVMNETQTNIANAIKKSGDSASLFSLKNFKLNKWIVGITSVGVIVTLLAALLQIFIAGQSINSGEIEKRSNSIINALTNIENTNSQMWLGQQSYEKELLEVEKGLLEEVRQLRKSNEAEMLLLRECS